MELRNTSWGSLGEKYIPWVTIVASASGFRDIFTLGKYVSLRSPHEAVSRDTLYYGLTELFFLQVRP